VGDSISDKELANRTAQGDQSAFLALYDRYAGRVHALAVRMMGDSMLAEEITQDTFLKLWDHARLYLAERGLLLPWLLTIARYTALDRLRLEGRRPLLSDAEDPELLWKKLPDPLSAPDEARWRSLYLIVHALPAEQRTVIELAYYQGLSQSEIAETLNWPLGTVKTRLRSAMESLRHAWLEER